MIFALKVDLVSHQTCKQKCKYTSATSQTTKTTQTISSQFLTFNVFLHSIVIDVNAHRRT